VRGAGHFATIDRLNGAAAALRLLYIDGRQDVDPEKNFDIAPVTHKPRYLGVVLLAELVAIVCSAQSRFIRSRGGATGGHNIERVLWQQWLTNNGRTQHDPED